MSGVQFIGTNTQSPVEGLLKIGCYIRPHVMAARNALDYSSSEKKVFVSGYKFLKLVSGLNGLISLIFSVKVFNSFFKMSPC